MTGVGSNDRRTTATPGDWIPLMDYAMKKGVSLSTLRRHIKANKIKYRVENGRYLLWDNEPGVSVPTDLPARVVMPSAQPVRTDLQSSMLQSKFQRLERDLQKAQEEIAELKMLVAIYEEKISRERLDS